MLNILTIIDDWNQESFHGTCQPLLLGLCLFFGRRRHLRPEVLKATMPGWNFSEHCLPLPDIAQRRARRDRSEADQADEEDSWVAEGLTAEDVQVLRDRAVELEKAGYMSMLPYFSTCDATSVEKKVGYPGYCQDGCDRFSG